MQIRKGIKSISACISCLLVLFSLVTPCEAAETEQRSAELVLCLNSAEADKINISGNVTFDEAGAKIPSGAAITTKEEFRYLRCFLKVSSGESFEIRTGAIAVTYKEGVGFSVEGATPAKVNNRELTSPIMVRVNVFGDRIEIGAKGAEEPEERLYEHIIVATAYETPTFAPVAVAAGEDGSLEAEYMEIFSLEYTVPMVGEDYDPSHDVPAFPKKPIKNDNADIRYEQNDLPILICGLTTVVVVAGVALILLIYHNKKCQRGKDDEKL